MKRVNKQQVTPNKIIVSAPSNIAFVKYWGKFGRQFPINPSVSMTLKNCVTQCEIEYEKSESGCVELTSYFFEGESNEKFYNRFNNYLKGVVDILPGLNQFKLKIKSHNTFPHSAGIASSASAFSALAYGITCIASEYQNGSDEFLEQCSLLARLGSGSAARSISGPFMQWGSDEELAKSSNEFAVLVDEIHPEFQKLKDTVLLVDKGEKSVSSSVGHSLMENHPFKDSRIIQARKNTHDILLALRAGDWENFGSILESEALTLHGLMMSSSPSFVLLKPNSLKILERVKDFRTANNINLYFTIDAGPNIHLIYKKEDEVIIEKFIERDLKNLCHEGSYIIDEIGYGAEVINDK